MGSKYYRFSKLIFISPPYDRINQQLVDGGTERLARSFSRRLSFLHDHPRAIAIVERWLESDGLLGDLTALNDLDRAMFENVAPVLPEAALAALKRVGDCPPDVAIMVWQRHLGLLRSLAYDPNLFERSAQMIVQACTQSSHKRESEQASDTFVSLFTIFLSGTHASIEQRLDVLERLLRSCKTEEQALGLAALDKVLRVTQFSSGYRFEFGARSRDFGYRPRSNADRTRWYGTALTLIERLALTEGVLKAELRDLVADNFRDLWALAHMDGELERLSRRFAADGFWCRGWVACRRTMYLDRNQLTPEVASRLSALEADLRPSNLMDWVRAVVIGDRPDWFDLEDEDIDGDPVSATKRLHAKAIELGSAVATDEVTFAKLLPDLLRGGNRTWAFGLGLAEASTCLRTTWVRLVEGLERIAQEQRNVQVLKGFLAEIWEKDRDLAQDLLDSAIDQPALVKFLPMLLSAVNLDERGVERLKRALSAGKLPVLMCRDLAFVRSRDHLEGGAFKALVLLIAEQPNGFDVALEILYMRLHSDRSAQREHEAKILEAGRELLRGVTFSKDNKHKEYQLADVVAACVIAPYSGPVAAEIAVRLRRAVAAYETNSWSNNKLLTALLEIEPAVVLEALFEGSEGDQQSVIGIFLEDHHDRNPADVIPCEALISWCEGDRERRYPLAASIITFAHRSEASGPQVWSEQAKALLANVPDPISVLSVFIKRFRPMGWSGSLAAMMEANARLLDSLEPHISPSLMPFLTKAKAQLAQEIARRRKRETEIDRVRDERFE